MIRTAATIACLAAVLVTSAAAGTNGAQTFRPRIANGLGLVPTVGAQRALVSGPGAQTPVTYHGGGVMNHGVTVHLIFWAPAGYAFEGSPGGDVPDYIGMIEQYYTDVAADSGPVSASNCATANGECNVFSTLTQFGAQSSSGAVTPGDYSIHFSAATDVILDTNPYPAQACASPNQTKTCILDSQLATEIDHEASTHGNGRGLTNLWYAFTPPDVDECIVPGACESNAYGGYHSVFNVNGNGPTIYAYTGDPIVETGTVLTPGSDPEGNPDAEVTVDTVAHETNEAMTDPEGVGWMDPNGYEVADKCENGPQYGTPLGVAPDGSPYNQVINGDEYLTQEIWSNDGYDGNPAQNCVQGTTAMDTGLPLPQVNLTQFSRTVTGNIGHATAGVNVTVSLLRGSAATRVARASGMTNANGDWSVKLAHPVGDDRDEIDVHYSGTGAPAPAKQVILTGNGGNPFTESGWTGWTAMDQGFALTNHDAVTGDPSLTIAPCFQTGVESYTIAGVTGAESPTDFCGTASGAADTPLAAPVSAGKVVTYSTNDNRAFQPPDAAVPNGAGGLVNMTVPVGEPDSVGDISAANFTGLVPTGFPTCTADLGRQRVTCGGLVPKNIYTVWLGIQKGPGLIVELPVALARADSGGFITARPFATPRDGMIILKNSASRTVTTLHVADIRVHIAGNSPTVESGTCSRLNYWGGPRRNPPINNSAGEPSLVAGGSALTGLLCPASGKAAGLPTRHLVQTDEYSGGSTMTEVAKLTSTSPTDGETMHGTFTALADASGVYSTISLSIARAGSKKPVARSQIVSGRGATVSGLKPGGYVATWTVMNWNGDTRVVKTRFIEAG